MRGLLVGLRAGQLLDLKMMPIYKYSKKKAIE
jgi:hypothetical protein